MLLKRGGISVTTFVLIGGILLMNGMIGGCNSQAAKAAPVRIAGTVTNSDGTPVSGVRLILTPDSGDVLSTAEYNLDQEGRFEGQALPGSYGFYFLPVAVELKEDTGKPVSKSEAKKLNDSTQSLNKLVPSAYRSPNGAGANGKVQVTGGIDIALVLTK